MNRVGFAIGYLWWKLTQSSNHQKMIPWDRRLKRIPGVQAGMGRAYRRNVD